MGQPIITRFEPAAIERLLRELGLDPVEHFGPEEAFQTSFTGHHDVRFGGAQRLVVATVAPDPANVLARDLFCDGV
jgi:hypothetical protein